MKSVLIRLSIIAVLSLTGCSDPDSVSGSGFERGIDDDISASHDAGATRSSRASVSLKELTGSAPTT